MLMEGAGKRRRRPPKLPYETASDTKTTTIAPKARHCATVDSEDAVYSQLAILQKIAGKIKTPSRFHVGKNYRISAIHQSKVSDRLSLIIGHC